jgi:hypothetical protein
MTRVVAAAVLAALIIPFPAQGQARPDFSGTWTLDQARSETPAFGRGGRGGRGGGAAAGPIVIKQTAAEITIGPATYKLDGSESVNQGRGGLEVTSKARWDGASLVIESSRDMRGMSITTKEVRTLGAGGTEMTVQTTATTPQGEQSFKQIYTKS